MKSEDKSLSAQMDSTNIDAPEETIVSIYKETEKPSLWTRFVTSVDTWHRWIDLILKVAVSTVIIILLSRWISFVIETIGTKEAERPTTSVLIALVSGTSVNLIGLLAIMAKYLFPDDKRK